MTRQTVTIELTFEVSPRRGQSPTEAAAQLAQSVIFQMSDQEGSLFEDFGARAEDLDDPEFTGWGGYEGPFLMSPRARALDATSSNLPKLLLDYIEETLSEDEYALYVLDGQRPDSREDDPDDWHDAIAVVETAGNEHVLKFTQEPHGVLTHYSVR